MRRPPHHEPVGAGLWKQRRVANIARANAALRRCYRVTPQQPTRGALAYAEIRDADPAVVLGYGIDHKGPWARVGDSRARARTPEAALAAALAKHTGVA